MSNLVETAISAFATLSIFLIVVAIIKFTDDKEH